MQKKNLPEGKFYNVDIENYPYLFMEEMFDYIIFPDVLEHLTQPNKVLNHFKQFLKPDGIIYITVPNLMNWALIYNLVICGEFIYEDTGLLDYDHKHLFTYNGIKKLLQDTGFKIEEALSIQIGSIPEEHKEIFNYFVKLSNNTININQY